MQALRLGTKQEQKGVRDLHLDSVTDVVLTDMTPGQRSTIPVRRQVDGSKV